MAFRQIILVLFCIMAAIVDIEAFVRSNRNLNKGKQKWVVVEKKQISDYLEILAARTKAVDAPHNLKCEADSKGYAMCRSFCQLEGANDGYCGSYGSEKVCICIW